MGHSTVGEWQVRKLTCSENRREHNPPPFVKKNLEIYLILKIYFAIAPNAQKQIQGTTRYPTDIGIGGYSKLQWITKLNWATLSKM